MRTLETSIQINAPVETVWGCLTNFDGYESWNPFIKSISGPLQTGEKLAISIQIDNKPHKFKPQVLSVSPEKEFRWKGSLGFPGIMDGEHYFILQSDGKTTTLIHGENFKGLLAWPFQALFGEKTKEGFHAMNQALKEKCEAA